VVAWFLNFEGGEGLIGLVANIVVEEKPIQASDNMTGIVMQDDASYRSNAKVGRLSVGPIAVSIFGEILDNQLTTQKSNHMQMSQKKLCGNLRSIDGVNACTFLIYVVEVDHTLMRTIKGCQILINMQNLVGHQY